MLEPDEGKLSSPVLRGEGGSNTADLLDRPSDIEQREGRIIRQGNKNKTVQIFRYVTEGTFDSYSWQLIENKQKFISQIMTSKSPVRSCEDIDEASLSYAEVKALATGNPYIKEKMNLDIQVAKLKLLKSNHTSQIYHLEDSIAKLYPQKISKVKEWIAAYRIDIEHYNQVKPVDKEVFTMKIGDRIFADKKEAGAVLIAFCREVKIPNITVPIGEYLGFKIKVHYDSLYHKFTLGIKGALTHETELGADASGNLTRLNNVLESMQDKLTQQEEILSNTEKQLANAVSEVTKPFPKDSELREKMEHLMKLNALLNMDGKGGEESARGLEEANEVQAADKPLRKTSIWEKLEQLKGQNNQNNVEIRNGRERSSIERDTIKCL